MRRFVVIVLDGFGIGAMDDAKIGAVPEITANHPDAALIHEAAIGRINNEQLIKLRTFGMTEEEAEGVIVEAFLN